MKNQSIISPTALAPFCSDHPLLPSPPLGEVDHNNYLTDTHGKSFYSSTEAKNITFKTFYTPNGAKEIDNKTFYTFNEAKEIADKIFCTPNGTKGITNKTFCRPNGAKEIDNKTFCTPTEAKEIDNKTFCTPNEAKGIANKAFCAPTGIKDLPNRLKDLLITQQDLMVETVLLLIIRTNKCSELLITGILEIIKTIANGYLSGCSKITTIFRPPAGSVIQRGMPALIRCRSPSACAHLCKMRYF